MKILLTSIVTVGILLSGCSSKQVIEPVNSIQLEKEKIMQALHSGISFYFDQNSTKIDSKYQPYLSIAAQSLQSNPSLKLVLEGHTDSSGRQSTNKRIALARAKTVKHVLVQEYQVNPEQVMTTGVGALQPMDSNHTAEGRANNRRVVATLKEGT